MTPCYTHKTRTYFDCAFPRKDKLVSCSRKGKKSRRTLSRKSARPHQIFTQEQLYCRNITHRSCSVIRPIFPAPLPLSVSLLLRESTPLHLSSTPPSPRLPRLLKCVLAQDPCLWQPECYTCAQNPARHKMAARQASPPEMSTAVCICRVCVSSVCTVFLWRISVRVCKCLRARDVHRHCQKKSLQKKK